MNPSWRVFPEQESLLAAAIEIVRQSEAESGSAFSIVLAGGQTPLALYRMLAHEPMQWQKWHVYFGDERCLPPQHPERNSTQAMQAWLAQVLIPAENIHIPAAERGPLEAAASYSAVVGKAGEFDLVLLGLGEDGHTASLFSGREIGDSAEAAEVLPVFDAPKPPPERISLSARRLSQARQVVFLVTGENKREAIARWRRGEDMPASRISASRGIVVLADEAACPSEFEQKGDSR